MARLWSSGFELNSLTAGVEIDSFSATAPTISSSVYRSGAYSLYVNHTSNSTVSYDFASTDQTSPFYFRFYLRLATSPDSQGDVFGVRSVTGANRVAIRINTDRTLELWNEEDSVQIGSDSSALDLDTWYRVELKVDTTTIASTAIEAKIDGSTFASGTENLSTGIGKTFFGNSWNGVTTEMYYDDVAINDSSGSYQNSWPGEGGIIHLRPNATGDNSDWTGDYTAIDEVTPNDDTDYISTKTSGQIEDVNLDATPAALASDDTINCVQVGMRYAFENPAQQPTSVLRIKASASGTVEESGATDDTAGTTWVTNSGAVPRNYGLTLYDLPGASTTEWTKSDLDSTQIGARCTAGAGKLQYFSTLWLLVDHKPLGVTNNDASASSTSTTNDSITSMAGAGQGSTASTSTVDDAVTINTTPGASTSDTSTLNDDVTVTLSGVSDIDIDLSAWYDPDWPYRVKVTVKNAKVDADLSNFPIYVDLSDLPADFHTNVNQTDGRDIRVTTSNGTTEVPREVVFYDSSTDTGELHFKGDILDASDVDFYIYYGNASATEPAVDATYGRNNVWSNYKAVYHMNEDPTGTVIDSTGNTPLNANVGLDSADLTTGKMGKGINKDTEEYWRNDTGISYGAGNDWSVQLWIEPNWDSNTAPGIYRSGDVSTGTELFCFNSTTGRPWIRMGGTDVLKPTEGFQVTEDVFTLIDLECISGSAVKFYTDGTLRHEASTAATTSLAVVNNLGWQASTTQEVLGIYDEVRFSSVTKSPEWISTEYNNQSDTSTFFDIGNQESGAGDTSTVSDAVICERVEGAVDNDASATSTSTISDSITIKAGDGVASVSDTSTVDDAITSQSSECVAVTSSTTTTDEAIIIVSSGGVASLADTSTVDDSATIRSNLNISISSTSTTDDSITSKSGSCVASVIDSSTTDDAILMSMESNVSISSTATVDDEITSVGGGGVASISDTSSVDDSITSMGGVGVAHIQDASTVGENIIATSDITSRNIPISDVSSIGEDIQTRLVPLNTTVVDVSTTDDSVEVISNLNAGVSDASTTDDSIETIAGSGVAVVSDTSTLDDAVTVRVNLNVTTASTSTIDDYLPPWTAGSTSTVSDSVIVETYTPDVTDVDASTSDTSTLDDTVTVRSDLNSSVADTSTTDDSVSGVGGGAVAQVTDASTVDDSVISEKYDTARNASTSSTSTTDDAVASIGGDGEAGIADTSTISDSVSGDAGDAVADISDTSTVGEGWPGYPVDGSYVSDEVTVETSFPENLKVVEVADTSTVDDSVTAITSECVANVTDTSTVDDNITAVGGSDLAEVSDTSSVDDAVTIYLNALNVIITDTSTTDDSIIIDATGDNYAIVSDTSSVSDAIISKAGAGMANVSDTSTTDDAVVGEVVNNFRDISVADTSTTNDSIESVGGAGQALVADTSTLDDDITINEYSFTRNIDISDASTTDDSIISVGGDAQIGVADTSTVDDAVDCSRAGAQNIHIVDGFGAFGGCKKKIIMVDGNLAMKVSCFYHIGI